jgi:hypothetical protein
VAEAWLSRQAQVDCRTLSAAARQQVVAAVSALEAHPKQLRPLAGTDGWLAMRVGEHRLLLRTLTEQERGTCGAQTTQAYLIARIVHWDDIMTNADGATSRWP